MLPVIEAGRQWSESDSSPAWADRSAVLLPVSACYKKDLAEQNGPGSRGDNCGQCRENERSFRFGSVLPPSD